MGGTYRRGWHLLIYHAVSMWEELSSSNSCVKRVVWPMHNKPYKWLHRAPICQGFRQQCMVIIALTKFGCVSHGAEEEKMLLLLLVQFCLHECFEDAVSTNEFVNNSGYLIIWIVIWIVQKLFFSNICLWWTRKEVTTVFKC